MKKKSHKKSSKKKSWSSESSEGEFEWVEKKVEPEEEKVQIKGPMLPENIDLNEIVREQEEETARASNWLGNEDFSALGKYYQKGKEKREETRRVANEELERVQKERELNPYLKDGGDGTKPAETVSAPKQSFGDGGLSWWTRALELCKQFAKEQNRSVESVAAERYGSLDTLMAKIKAAQEMNDSMNQDKTKFYRPGQMSSSNRGGYNRDSQKDYDRRRDYKSDDRNRDYRSENRNRDYRDDNRNRDYRRNEGSRDDNWRRKDREFDKSKASSKTDIDKDSEKSKSKPEVDREFEKPRSYSKPEIEKPKDTIAPKRTRTPSPSSSSSSSSTSDVEMEESSKKEPEPVKVDDFYVKYGRKDANQLGAEIIKAELMGDDELVVKLKDLLETERTRGKRTDENNVNKRESQVIIATKTDRFGNEIPLTKNDLDSKEELSKRDQKKRQKKTKNLYTKEGERETYFADDNKYSLKDLVEKEKHISVEDNNLMFTTIKPKLASKLTSDNMDDDILDNCITKQLDGWSKIKVLAEQRSKNESMNTCEFCLENAKKHLIVSLGSKSYVCVPETTSLVDGHCFIVPIQHFISSLMVDEDVWSEMQNFRRALVNMFKSRNMDCIFVEQFSNEKSFQHMIIECIPINYEASEVAPMYFKKALLEAEKEWATNKPVIDLKGKGVRKGLPKGLPYFAVDFGLEDGFGHIIENKTAFPDYFAKEIIGGIMDLDPYLWRKAKKEKFSEQSKKVIDFLKFWKAFDFNKTEQT